MTVSLKGPDSVNRWPVRTGNWLWLHSGCSGGRTEKARDVQLIKNAPYCFRSSRLSAGAQSVHLQDKSKTESSGALWTYPLFSWNRCSFYYASLDNPQHPPSPCPGDWNISALWGHKVGFSMQMREGPVWKPIRSHMFFYDGLCISYLVLPHFLWNRPPGELNQVSPIVGYILLYPKYRSFRSPASVLFYSPLFTCKRVDWISSIPSRSLVSHSLTFPSLLWIGLVSKEVCLAESPRLHAFHP